MDRETKPVFVLPKSGAKVELYAYLLGGEKRQIRKIAIDAMNMSMNASSSEPEIKDVSGGFTMDMEDLALKFLVKSIEGSDGKIIAEERITEFVYNLSDTDSDFLYDAVNEVTAASDMTKDDKKK